MNPSKPKCKRVRPLLGTYVEIELCGQAPEQSLHDWMTAGFEAVQEIDRLMSAFRTDSDLSRLNQVAPDVWVRVHPHTVKVLAAANDLYSLSEGHFDIRCGGRQTSDAPPVQIRGRQARKTGPWTFDLGGIAKGYAVDCAVETIQNLSQGYRLSGVVNAGGDLRKWGNGSAVAVATSAVRTAQFRDRLSPAVHVQMPAGKIMTKQKAVTVLADLCLWSDALTKVMLLAPQRIANRCLKHYQGKGLVLA